VAQRYNVEKAWVSNSLGFKGLGLESTSLPTDYIFQSAPCRGMR
jgi:hypothetical protein